jgi:2',3'-cyclic-nucleotide 2'-phosphodiesterase (5'-nucleotidase family)
VDASVAPDPALSALVSNRLAAAERLLDEEIGVLGAPLEAKSKYPGQSPVQALIARAIAGATGAELVFHGTLSQADLKPGPLTVRDVWRLVPYENTLGVVSLTGEDLRAILEENAALWSSRQTQFRGVLGVTYELDPKAAPGQRVRALRLADDRELGPGERVRVAFNSFDLASGGDRFPCLREIAERPESAAEPAHTRQAVTTTSAPIAPRRAGAGAAPGEGGAGVRLPAIPRPADCAAPVLSCPLGSSPGRHRTTDRHRGARKTT